MADTLTPIYNFVKPEVGGSDDTWGTKWNLNADSIETRIKAAMDQALAALDAAAKAAQAGTYVIADATVTTVDGALFCDGAPISRVTYSVLYGKIGTTYGAGDGTTTFNKPDWRGVFMRGLDSGRGLDPSRVAGSLQTDDVKSHTHVATLTNR